MLENIVYNELAYRGYDVAIGKTYKDEIDFVAMRDGIIIPQAIEEAILIDGDLL